MSKRLNRQACNSLRKLREVVRLNIMVICSLFKIIAAMSISPLTKFHVPSHGLLNTRILNTNIIGYTAVCSVNIFEVQEIANKIVKGDNNE